MAGIFISYRRDDSAGFAGRLADDLKDYFSADLVFMDVTGIAAGIDFRKVIEEKVGACDVLLVVIGKSWAAARNAASEPRLQDAKDFVRLEVASALKRDIPVIPVLVDGASMPAAADLPADLEALAWRNAVELRHARWDADLQALIAALKNIVPPAARHASSAVEPVESAPQPVVGAPRSPRRWPSWKLIVAGVAALTVGLVAAIKFVAKPEGSSRTAGAQPAASPSGPVAPPEASQVMKPDGKYPARLPAGMEATLGTANYKILFAHLERRTSEKLGLVLFVRMTSNGDYGDNFWSNSFRLVAGDQRLEPIDVLNQLVDGHSAKEGEVTFAFDGRLRNVELEISHGNETTRIPIDLAAAKPGLLPGPLRTRLPGPFPLTLAAGAEARVYDATVRILSAQIEQRNRQELTLTLSLRMTNPGSSGQNFWDRSFRLVADGVPRAPASGLNELVEGRSSKNGEITFVFDDTVESLVLLVYSGKEVTRVPFDLRQRAT